MRGLVIAAIVVLATAPALEAQSCTGVRAGRMGEVSASLQTGGWQADEAWRTEARSVSLRGVGGRFRFEASQSDLLRRASTDEGTGRSISAGYSHPVMRVAPYGAITCLTAGLEFTEMVAGENTIVEPNIPIGLAWGLDLLPMSALSLIPHVEVGAFARELDGWNAGVYSVAGMTAVVSRISVRASSRQRLRVARPVQHLSVGLTF